VLVVDRVVAGLALELGQRVVAQRGDAGRVDEADRALRVDDPDGLRHAVEDGLHRLLPIPR
jgi:hypothetical protein